MTDRERQATRKALAALDAATRVTVAAMGSVEVEFETTAQEFFVQMFDRAIECLNKTIG